MNLGVTLGGSLSERRKAPLEGLEAGAWSFAPAQVHEQRIMTSLFTNDFIRSCDRHLTINDPRLKLALKTGTRTARFRSDLVWLRDCPLAREN